MSTLKVRPWCLSPYGYDVFTRAQDALRVASWLEDDTLRDELASVADQVEAYLSPIMTLWDDGYRIVRVTGGPLVDDAEVSS